MGLALATSPTRTRMSRWSCFLKDCVPASTSWQSTPPWRTPGTSPAPASSISCSCTMHNACCCTEFRRCEWVRRCCRYKWRSRCRCYCIRCRCCSMCWNKCGCWSNINITVDTAASELVDVEVNDQEVQRRRVRGLLPPWSSDGWKNVELMLLLICGRMFWWTWKKYG